MRGDVKNHVTLFLWKTKKLAEGVKFD